MGGRGSLHHLPVGALSLSLSLSLFEKCCVYIAVGGSKLQGTGGGSGRPGEAPLQFLSESGSCQTNERTSEQTTALFLAALCRRPKGHFSYSFTRSLARSVARSVCLSVGDIRIECVCAFCVVTVWIVFASSADCRRFLFACRRRRVIVNRLFCLLPRPPPPLIPLSSVTTHNTKKKTKTKTKVFLT